MGNATHLGDESGGYRTLAEFGHAPAERGGGEGDEAVSGEAWNGVQFEDPGTGFPVDSQIDSDDPARADCRGGGEGDFTDPVDELLRDIGGEVMLRLQIGVFGGVVEELIFSFDPHGGE